MKLKEMNNQNRHISFWIVNIFLILTAFGILAGQTFALINYELLVQFGLQESVEEIGEIGVNVNKAFAVSDTLIYLPLIVLSIIGAIKRTTWSLSAISAVMGITAYWSLTVMFELIFLKGTSGFLLVPNIVYWLVLSGYFLSGVIGLIYVFKNGRKIIM